MDLDIDRAIRYAIIRISNEHMNIRSYILKGEQL